MQRLSIPLMAALLEVPLLPALSGVASGEQASAVHFSRIPWPDRRSAAKSLRLERSPAGQRRLRVPPGDSRIGSDPQAHPAAMRRAVQELICGGQQRPARLRYRPRQPLQRQGSMEACQVEVWR